MAARKQSCYLKLGEHSFDAVKFALKDKQNRVNVDKIDHQHSYITKIAFEGAGSLGGTAINLSPELNCLIGIRGSGKSSVLEGIRYALDIPFGDKSADTAYKTGLVQHLLQSGGKIIVEAIDRHGQIYQISRILNEQPDIYVHGQIQPGVSLRETVLHKPIYFGQKDLSSSGEGFEKDLIEKLLGEAVSTVRADIAAAKVQVEHVIKQIEQLTKNADSKLEWQNKKQDAEFKLKLYQQHGVEEKLQKQISFDKDERKARQVIDNVKHYLQELNLFIANFEDDMRNLSHHKSTHNSVFFDNFFKVYQPLLTGIESLKSVAANGAVSLSQLVECINQFIGNKKAMKEEFAHIERQLATELQQSGAQAINTQEFKQISALIEQATQMLELLAKSEQQHSVLSSQLKDKLSQLEALYVQEYQIIASSLDSINSQDSPLKINFEFKSDKAAMLVKLQEVMRGSRMRENTLQGMVDCYADFAQMWHDKDNWGAMLATSTDNFVCYFQDKLNELLTWQVPNQFTIEYHGKALANHSLGQRASALMLFVLSQHDNDVVMIDQPEDDLDNQTIYNDVIKLIRRLKPSTQFIFATHNANIPVLGDADQVMACDYQQGHTDIDTGSIDNKIIQEKIVSIMEGGTEAFEKRKQVYETWKPQS